MIISTRRRSRGLGSTPPAGIDPATWAQFDPDTVMKKVAASNAMMDAMTAGNVTAYQQAQAQYQALTGGAIPVWAGTEAENTLRINSQYAAAGKPSTTGVIPSLATNPYAITAPIPPAEPKASAPSSQVPVNSRMSFTNTTSGNASSFLTGDKWTITITGALPGTPVAVYGGKGGAYGTSQMGTVDSSGNFTLSGVMDDTQVGNWYEKWTWGVPGGTVQTQEINFTVSARQSSVPSTQVTGTGNSGNSTTTPAIPGTAINQNQYHEGIFGYGYPLPTPVSNFLGVGQSALTKDSLGLGVPNWVYLAAAFVGYKLVTNKEHSHAGF